MAKLNPPRDDDIITPNKTQRNHLHISLAHFTIPCVTNSPLLYKPTFATIQLPFKLRVRRDKLSITLIKSTPHSVVSSNRFVITHWVWPTHSLCELGMKIFWHWEFYFNSPWLRDAYSVQCMCLGEQGRHWCEWEKLAHRSWSIILTNTGLIWWST